MELLIFLLILSVLIYIHELGHFFMARRAGVKVDEFGFGYPPKAVRLFTDKKGTDYTLNWLPFGGFVRLHGEDEEVSEGEDEAFYTKSKKKRLGIILAGVVMNFLFGVVAFGAIYTKTGIPTEFDYVRIDEINVQSPAEAAGLVAGDTVVGIVVDGERQDILGVEEFKTALGDKKGQEVTLVVNEGEERVVYVRIEEEIPENEGAIGVTISDMDFVHYPIWQMPFRGIWLGLQTAVSFGWFLLGAILGMFKDLFFAGKVPQDVAGPVGIGHQVVRDSLLTRDLISVQNFSFAAIISINLMILNLLPFPALDGGRALFIMLEGLVGQKKLEKIERRVNTVGFILLLVMISLVSIRDIRGIFMDENVQSWFRGLIGK